jgi:hypothetical protein
MRHLLLWCGAGLVLVGCGADDGGLGLPPPPERNLSATATASGDNQSGGISTTLPLPLRVVLEAGGTKVPGATVSWSTGQGSIEPQSVTDGEGIATAAWTLDTIPGTQSATASVVGAPNKVSFHATAVPLRPAVALTKGVIGNGDGQTVSANAASFQSLRVLALDEERNRASGQVAWTIESGPVRFVEPAGGPTDAMGISTAWLRPIGTEGHAVVRASLTGTASSVAFTLTVGPPHYLVRLSSSSFLSLQNGTQNPAVDTIPAGATVTWQLDFDYDPHRVVSVGTPAFATPGDFPYAGHPEVSVTFTVPGTYHYTDFYNSAVTGIVVVQ